MTVLGCGIGSWSGRCLSLAPYVTGTGPTDGATAPPEGANVGHPHQELDGEGIGRAEMARQ